MRSLAHREKTLIGLAVPGLLAAALWAVIWQPALERRDVSFSQLSKLDTLRAALLAKPVSGVPALPVLSTPLQQRVTASARASGLDIRRLDPQGSALSVSLDDVSFQDFVAWVGALTAEQAVRVLSAEIGRLPEPGRASVRILLEAI